MNTQTVSLTPASAGAPEPMDALVGRRAVYTTWDGERIVGTLAREGRKSGPRHMWIEFDNGTHAIASGSVEVLA